MNEAFRLGGIAALGGAALGAHQSVKAAARAVGQIQREIDGDLRALHAGQRLPILPPLETARESRSHLGIYLRTIPLTMIATGIVAHILSAFAFMATSESKYPLEPFMQGFFIGMMAAILLGIPLGYLIALRRALRENRARFAVMEAGLVEHWRQERENLIAGLEQGHITPQDASSHLQGIRANLS